MVSQSTTRWLFIRVRAVVLTGGGLFVRAPRQSSEQEVIKQPLSRCDESFCGNGASPRPPRIKSGREGGAWRQTAAFAPREFNERGRRWFIQTQTPRARGVVTQALFFFFFLFFNGALKMRAINPPERSNWLLMEGWESGGPSLARGEGAQRSTCWPLAPEWLRGLSLRVCPWHGRR